ncbi:MAG: esterase [Clostridia bacterium]|nr:esterase [Clostridia bacterium]
MENMNYTVTSIETLKQYTQGTVVPLTGFDGDPEHPFVARLKRPSMLALAKSGKIPNALLSTASDLFANGSNAVDEDDNTMMSRMFDMCVLMAKASMVEPTYEQLEEIGLQLTDEQLIEIFNFTQKGIKALSGFRR